MPKVIITVNQSYSAIGVRMLLGEIGVCAPIYQDETSITTVMSEDQIHRFRNSKGAAHKLEVVVDAPPPAPALEVVPEQSTTPILDDAAPAPSPLSPGSYSWGRWSMVIDPDDSRAYIYDHNGDLEHVLEP